MVIPRPRRDDPCPAMVCSTCAGVHWAAIWRGDGRPPMTFDRRAIGPPSSSVDIQAGTCPWSMAVASRAAMPAWMAGPDPAAGCPKRTTPPTPAEAIDVEAPRSENWPLTMMSCSTRWATGQDATGLVQPASEAAWTAGGAAPAGTAGAAPAGVAPARAAVTRVAPARMAPATTPPERTARATRVPPAPRKRVMTESPDRRGPSSRRAARRPLRRRRPVPRCEVGRGRAGRR